LRSDNKIIFGCGRDTHLATQLVLLARLAFGDAFHFRRVQAVQLVLVLALLPQQPARGLKQRRKLFLRLLNNANPPSSRVGFAGRPCP